MPVGSGLGIVIGGRLGALAVLVFRLVGDRVGAAQPAGEIHVGAAVGAERSVFQLGGPAADRALAAAGGGLISAMSPR